MANLTAILETYGDGGNLDSTSTKVVSVAWDRIEQGLDGVLKKSAETKLKSVAVLKQALEDALKDEVDKELCRQILDGFSFALVALSEDEMTPPQVSITMVECADMLFTTLKNRVSPRLPEITSCLLLYCHAWNTELARISTRVMDQYFAEEGGKRSRLYDLIGPAFATKIERIVKASMIDTGDIANPSVLSVALAATNALLVFQHQHKTLGDIELSLCKKLFAERLPSLSRPDAPAALRSSSLTLIITLIKLLDAPMPANYLKLISKFQETDSSDIISIRCRFAIYCLENRAEVIENAQLLQATAKKLISLLWCNREPRHLEEVIRLMLALFKADPSIMKVTMGASLQSSASLARSLKDVVMSRLVLLLLMMSFLENAEVESLVLDERSRIVLVPGARVLRTRDQQSGGQSLVALSCLDTYLMGLRALPEMRDVATTYAVCVIKAILEAAKEGSDSSLDGTLFLDLHCAILSPMLPLAETVMRWSELSDELTDFIWAFVDTHVLTKDDVIHPGIERDACRCLIQARSEERVQALVERLTWTKHMDTRQDVLLEAMERLEGSSAEGVERALKVHIRAVLDAPEMDDLQRLQIIRRLARDGLKTCDLQHPVLTILRFLSKDDGNEDRSELDKEVDGDKEVDDDEDILSEVVEALLAVFASSKDLQMSGRAIVEEVLSKVESDDMAYHVLRHLEREVKPSHKQLVAILDDSIRGSEIATVIDEVRLLAAVWDVSRELPCDKMSQAVADLITNNRDSRVTRIVRQSEGETFLSFFIPRVLDALLNSGLLYSFLARHCRAFLSIQDATHFKELEPLLSCLEGSPTSSAEYIAVLALRQNLVQCYGHSSMCVEYALRDPPGVPSVWNIDTVRRLIPAETCRQIDLMTRVCLKATLAEPGGPETLLEAVDEDPADFEARRRSSVTAFYPDAICDPNVRVAELLDKLRSSPVERHAAIPAMWAVCHAFYLCFRHEQRVDWKAAVLTLRQIVDTCPVVNETPELLNVVLRLALHCLHAGRLWMNEDHAQAVFAMMTKCDEAALWDLGELFCTGVKPWFISELLDAELEPSNCIAVLEDVSELLFPLIDFYSQLLSLSSIPLEAYAFWDASMSDILVEYRRILGYFKAHMEAEALDMDLDVLSSTRTNLKAIIHVFCAEGAYSKLARSMSVVESVLLTYPFNRFPLFDFCVPSTESTTAPLSMEVDTSLQPEEFGVRAVQQLTDAVWEPHSSTDGFALYQMVALIFGQELTSLFFRALQTHSEVGSERIVVLFTLIVKAAESDLATSIPEWAKRLPVPPEAEPFQDFIRYTYRLSFALQLLLVLPASLLQSVSIDWSLPILSAEEDNPESVTRELSILEVDCEEFRNEMGGGSVVRHMFQILLDDQLFEATPHVIPPASERPRVPAFMVLRTHTLSPLDTPTFGRRAVRKTDLAVSGVSRLIEGFKKQWAEADSTSLKIRTLAACLIYVFPDEARCQYGDANQKVKKRLQTIVADPQFVQVTREGLSLGASIINSLYAPNLTVQFDGMHMMVKLQDTYGEAEISIRIDTDTKGFPLTVPPYHILNPQFLQGLAPNAHKTYIVTFARCMKGLSGSDVETLRSNFKGKYYYYGGALNIFCAILEIRMMFMHLFEKQSDCLICYSIVHKDTRQLPNNKCGSCGNKFHSCCLQKWYETSHNTRCPICRCIF